MLSTQEIMAKRYGMSHPVEQLVTGAATTYTINTFERGEMIRVQNTADSYIRFCREYVWGGNFGGPIVSPPIPPGSIWATNTEGSELLQSKWSGGVEYVQERLWSTAEMADSSAITLDLTLAVDAASHSLEFALDDQDNVLVNYLNGRISRTGRVVQEVMPAGETLSLHVRHIESNAAVPIEYQIEECGNGALAQKYWTGAAWSLVEAAGWVTITGSAVEATFLDVVTLDREAIYKLRIRPETEGAETSNISSIGLVEAMTIADGSGTFISAEVPYTMVVPYRCKIGCDAAGAGLLDVCRMLT